MEVKNELTPVTHFLAKENELYFVQNRAIQSFNTDDFSTKIIAELPNFSSKVQSLELAGDVIYITTLRAEYTYDLFGNTLAYKAITQYQGNRELLIESFPEVYSRQWFGTAFCACENYGGGFQPAVYQNGNVARDNLPSCPVFNISTFGKKLAISCGKFAVFEDGMHEFIDRCFISHAENNAAGSEVGELLFNGRLFELYNSGVRGLDRHFVLQNNGAIFKIGQGSDGNSDINNENGNINSSNYSARVAYREANESLTIQCYIFSPTGEIRWETIVMHEPPIMEILILPESLICLHSDGSVSSNVGHFVPNRFSGKVCGLFCINETGFLLSKLNNKFVVYELFVEEYGIVEGFIEQMVTINDCKEISKMFRVECKNGRISLVGFEISLDFTSYLSPLCGMRLANKELNCACVSATNAMIVCGSEEGLLQVFDYKLKLIYSYALHTSIKSIILESEERNYLKLIVGCCENKLFAIVLRFDFEWYISSITRSKYERELSNIKYTSLCKINEVVCAAGDSAGNVYLFLLANNNFALLQCQNVGFCIFSIEYLENSLFISGSRGLTQISLFECYLDQLLTEDIILCPSIADIRQFKELAGTKILTHNKVLISEEVIHQTSKHLLAFDSGFEHHLPSGILACLRTDKYDFFIGWDRILREYKDNIEVSSVEVSFYEIHALLELPNEELVVVGNGLAIIQSE